MLTTALRNVLAHKARLAMTVLAVCLGVAFVSGTLVFADSTTAAHRAAATKNFAGIALTVTAKEPAPASGADQGGGVLDDALVRTLADVPGVAAVRPSAEGSAVLNAADGSPLRVGARWANQAAAYVPGKDGTDARYPLAEGRAPANGDELAVDRGTAAAGRLRIGDQVTVATDGPAMTKRLVGTVTTDDTRVTAGGTLVLFDRATAQHLFATPGHYTGIDLAAAPGTEPAELARRVSAVLPADRAETTTGAAQAAQQTILVDTLTRGYEKLPLVFAGVSLFIASFLIVNTFTMLVARRTREIALLRAIGAQRRQVARSVLLEALVVGLAASAAGFVLGLGIAAALPGLLGDGLPRGPLVIGPGPVVAALAVGVGVTVLAAWLPSRRAARVAPIEALRTAEQPPPAHRLHLRAAAGLVLVALAAALLVSLRGAKDASEANLQSAMLGCAVLVCGLIALAPVLAAPVIRTFGRLTGRLGVAGRLARENALRDPRRTAATAATLMISTALVTGLATVGHSAEQALDRRAAAGLAADYVIGSRSTMDGLDPAAVGRIAATPGVRTASAVTDSTLVAGGAVLEVAGIDPDGAAAVLKLDVTGGSVADLGPGRIAVSATVAREHHLAPGDRLDARLGRTREARPYTVVAVYRDNPTARDVLAARAEVARNSYLPDSVQRVLVRTADGTASPAVEQRLRAAVGNSPLVKVQDRAQLVREASGVMGDLLAVLYGLLAVGALIGALGIVNTLAVSVAERTREIGVLRAVGLDRAGVRRMIRLEAVTVAAYGTLLGLAAGLAGAWAVGPLATGAVEHYEPALPWGTLLLVCAVSLAIGALASAVPARRAASLGPLAAAAEA
ncbi:FtsX-like permease family protein [Streptomyces sp. SP17BM10]|uniref:ABC transporter permease n=1 Tax=Streptomyces sp. SP17BM10 TaxID=3002530 RepID=UPI002E76C337|nr:FtsX-like permease family protein [Streptomyces sp. SP17BM10]MEE1786156.1 FtsX-like permease family protein [Streptomyces sp. SP17BM10]